MDTKQYSILCWSWPFGCQDNYLFVGDKTSQFITLDLVFSHSMHCCFLYDWMHDAQAFDVWYIGSYNWIQDIRILYTRVLFTWEIWIIHDNNLSAQAILKTLDHYLYQVEVKIFQAQKGGNSHESTHNIVISLSNFLMS